MEQDAMKNEKSGKKINYLKVSSDTDYRKLIWDQEKSKFTDKEKEFSPIKLRKEVEPWLTALFQSERLNLLVGSGLTTSQEILAVENENHTNFMELMEFNVFSDQIETASTQQAKQNGRKEPNIEDQINAANTLLEGLNIYIQSGNNKEELKKDAEKLRENINKNMETFINKILSVEKNILSQKEETKKYLVPFLMSFASRSSTRERLHIFTTNYDRVIEWGADLTGLRLIDRFIGNIEPVSAHPD